LTNTANHIDFSRIRQPKLKQFLQKHGLVCSHSLAKIKCTNYNETLEREYFTHSKSFSIQADIDTVWNTYKTIRPDEILRGSMVSFGFMYCRKSDRVTFSDDQYHGLAAGQVLFLHLNLFSNMVNLAVGHEVTSVNDAEKNFQTCYLEQGVSAGSQHIQLNAISKTTTEVVHVTRYRSGSLFRDKVLYPSLHTRAITEFHSNVKKKAEVIVH
jgi:hypothetical protein